MIIEPIIHGVVAKSAHPAGCHAAVKEQIEIVRNSNPIKNGPKRVLILGASSGFGLAARTALTFGGADAKTIGVSFERGPTDKRTGTAGWYNNIHFKYEADKLGLTAINIVGDAFSTSIREEVIEAIETHLDGEVDLIIYSLATGVRPKNESEMWRSAIKPIDNAVSGASINLETNEWLETTLQPASESEIESTIKVMGGEDWESWVDLLINHDSIAEGCKTIAFSYIGPKATYPIYHEGTLGRAKIDLHQTSHTLNLKLANYNGGAYATVCKALTTKASVFIPAFTPYILALYKVMKKQGNHEGCIEQMQRLFTEKLYGQQKVPVDGQRLLRMDDWELNDTVQLKVEQLMTRMNASNFKEMGDYEGYKSDFLKLNGFGFDSVDYHADVDLSVYEK